MTQTFYKKISSKDVFDEYIKIVNGILNLSNRESELFSLLLKLNLGSNSEDIVCNSNRKLIMSETRMNKSNLSKYISNFKDLGILSTNGMDRYFIHEYFKPKFDDGKLDIVFSLNIED